MRHFILVRHSITQIDANRPSKEWRLSEQGRLLCKPLAERLTEYQPTTIVSSTEPKAIETAKITAAYLGKTFETAEGLHEHERQNVDLFKSGKDFEKAVQNFFDAPDELIFGDETANQAKTRFTKVTEEILSRHKKGNVIVVAHGTVITLFVAELIHEKAFEFWQKLGMPAFIVMALPEFKILRIENIP